MEATQRKNVISAKEAWSGQGSAVIGLMPQRAGEASFVYLSRVAAMHRYIACLTLSLKTSSS